MDTLIHPSILNVYLVITKVCLILALSFLETSHGTNNIELTKFAQGEKK